MRAVRGDLPAHEKLFKAIVLAGFSIEGVVAKRRASTYEPGVARLEKDQEARLERHFKALKG